MESPTLGIRCRIVARIPTGIHRFNGNSHKIRSDSYRTRVGPVVGLNLLGSEKKHLTAETLSFILIYVLCQRPFYALIMLMLQNKK